MKLLLALDPRVLLGGFISVVVWTSTASSMFAAIAWAALAIASVTVVAIRGRISISITNLAAAVLIMSALTLTLYFLFSPAQTENVLAVGSRMVLRLIALTLFALAFVASSDPLRLAAGVTRILLPLRRIGLPVARVFYLTFFLVRMIPHLLNESRMIRLAQQSRGVATSGHMLLRLRSAPALVIPIFAAGLRRGDQTALALSARGFDSECIPPAVHDLRLSGVAILVLVALLVGWAIWIAVRVG